VAVVERNRPERSMKVATADERRVGPVPRGVERNRPERSVKVAMADKR
jgi:hypothetical protein